MFETSQPQVEKGNRAYEDYELYDEQGLALCQIFDEYTLKRGFFDLQDLKADADVIDITTDEQLAALGPVLSSYRNVTIDRMAEIGISGQWMFPNASLLRNGYRITQQAFVSAGPPLQKMLDPVDITWHHPQFTKPTSDSKTTGAGLESPVVTSTHGSYFGPSVYGSRMLTPAELAVIYDDQRSDAVPLAVARPKPSLEPDAPGIVVALFLGSEPNPLQLSERDIAGLIALRSKWFQQLGTDSVQRDQMVAHIASHSAVSEGLASELVSIMYQARLLGRSSDGQAVTADPTFRRQRGKLGKGLAKDAAGPEASVVDGAERDRKIKIAGMILGCMIEQLDHVQQSLTPDKIVSFLYQKYPAAEVSEDDVKKVCRLFSGQFETVVTGKTVRNRNLSKGRSQQVLKIRILNQHVKDAWKSDPLSVIADMSSVD